MDKRLITPPVSSVEGDISSIVPEESPCVMPVQALWVDRGPKTRARRQARYARAFLLLLSVAATGVFAWMLYRVLSVEPPTTLQLVFWVISTACFAWIAIGSTSALIGFAALMGRGSVDTLELPMGSHRPRERTALLFPVYQEDPAGIAAGIDTICRDLIRADAGRLFDAFILSDTQNATARVLESRIYPLLRAGLDGKVQIFCRWRTPNTEKKAGNIRDWVERFGAAYPHFIILDADSLMSAATLMRLAGAMEANPRIGLIQTVPRLVGGTTLFARLQQFAAGYYGRVVSAGLAAWHGRGGNYWGHNAIIRTEAFARAAGLPHLSGAPPLGGHILSHDFVEAALLRRAGWEVHLVPSLDGSFEGCPPTLTDLIVRDRRWAQGNLQHVRLLGVRGLPLLSRIHLAMGAFSYIASLIWALTLLVGVVLSLQAKYVVPSYFGSEASLFPKWPVFDSQTALALFIATVAVVHLPKLLGLAWALRNQPARAANGGAGRLLGGLLFEAVLSTLIAPVLMLTQSGAIISILLGKDAGWGVQRRAGSSSRFMPLIRRYKWHLLWGLAAAAVCWAISPAVLAWMSPIVAGLLLAPVLTLITAAEATGGPARLLETEEERQTPAILQSYRAALSQWTAATHEASQAAPSRERAPAANAS